MNRVGHALRNAAVAVGTAFVWAGHSVAHQISLVPSYLSHLLWLVSQTYRELADKGYRGNAAVYAVLRLLCSAVPEPPLIPYVQLADGEAGDALAWNHDLRRLIRYPNPLTSEYEFWELVTLHCGVVGRSTWWKERDRAGRLIALWPLRPDRVGPIYGTAADGMGADAVLVGWSYQIPGTAQYVPIPRGDILLFNLPDPMGESGGMVEGLGPLQVLAAEIGADNEATRYVGSLLANDARPGTVLKIKGKITSADDARLIKSAYTQEFSGRGRGKVGIVDNDTEVISVGFNLRDLEFPALRRISESRIASAFGVPAMLVGLLVGIEHATFSNYAEAREYFAETTCGGYWRRFSDTYTNDIAAEYGVNIVCQFDITKVRALQGQAIIELDRTRDAYDRGILTPNEYREALNLAPHPDGDFLPAAQKPKLALAVTDPETGTNIAPIATPPASAIGANGKVVADSTAALAKAA